MVVITTDIKVVVTATMRADIFVVYVKWYWANSWKKAI